MRWQCRRGMLELDLLFSTFIDQLDAPLSAAEHADLLHLLGCQDQQLHDWLIGGNEPEEPRLRALVARILAAQSGATASSDA
nr:succinate dehydrogenase assembly factor 2 [Rhabdochromatium marinum]